MKKIFLILLSILISQFSFSQSNNEIVDNQLIVKFKSNKKPDKKSVYKNQRFENSAMDLLNNDYDIQSMTLTGNKKQEDTYVLTFNSNKSVKDLIELYKNTGLFEYV